jgi:hypothetical protein
MQHCNAVPRVLHCCYGMSYLVPFSNSDLFPPIRGRNRLWCTVWTSKKASSINAQYSSVHIHNVLRIDEDGILTDPKLLTDLLRLLQTGAFLSVFRNSIDCTVSIKLMLNSIDCTVSFITYETDVKFNRLYITYKADVKVNRLHSIVYYI